MVGTVKASALLSLEQSQGTVAALAAYLDSLDSPTRIIGLALIAELYSPFHGNGSDPAHPLLESVRVTGDALNRYAAVQADRQMQRWSEEKFGAHVEKLQQANFAAIDLSAGNEPDPTPTARSKRGNTLFDIVRIKEWDNPGSWAMSRVSWLVRAGQWAYWNMNEAGRVLLCRIAAASLSHEDAETVSLTFRLGRELGFKALSVAGGACHDASVGDMLGEGEVKSLSIDGQSLPAYRRFNSALFSLCRLGALSEIAWPPDYRFDRIADGGDLDGWLESRIKLRAMTVPRPREGKPPHRAMDPLHI